MVKAKNKIVCVRMEPYVKQLLQSYADEHDMTLSEALRKAVGIMVLVDKLGLLKEKKEIKVKKVVLK